MPRRLSVTDLRQGDWLRRPIHGGTVADVLRLVLFGVVLSLLVTLAIGLRWSPSPPYQEGEVATVSIKAPRATTFTSEVLTEAARRDAAQDPGTIQLRLEPAVAEEQVRRLGEALNEITRVRLDTALSISQRLERLAGLTSVKLPEDQINSLLNLDDAEWNAVVSEARAVLRRALERQIIADEINVTRERLRDWVRPSLTDVQRNLVVTLAGPFVRANVVVDSSATERNRQRARDEVQPVRVTVQRGEVVIRDGAIVTAIDAEKLEQLGLRDRSTTLAELAGIGLLVSTLTALLLTYVVLFQPTIWRTRTMILVGVVIVTTVVGARLTFPTHPMAEYAYPVATAAMVLAVLLDAHLAILAGAYLALTIGLVGDNSLELVMLAFAMCIGGAFVMWRADRTARFLWAGLVVGLLGLSIAVGFRLTSQNFDAAELLQLGVLSAANGALAAGLTFVAFSVLGSLFGITTVLQLLELAHPNQPVLRRLAREAPGTYHHSIVVSSLAEAAAEQIGADPLFTRVAVYYHDIGKVLRPYFFVENQANMDNVHDSLDPRTSAQIIIGHVADGEVLAKRHRLPNRIVDIIREHHGTTQVRYFLHKALERGEPVNEADYTYPGPRPQTKEAGIIMLADAVEATVRSQYQSGTLLAASDEIPGDDVGVAVTPDDQIGQIVNRIVNDRLSEGQLDECGLTLQDLNRIRSAFVAVLTSIYHPRIDYPAARRATTVVTEPVVR